MSDNAEILRELIHWQHALDAACRRPQQRRQVRAVETIIMEVLT